VIYREGVGGREGRREGRRKDDERDEKADKSRTHKLCRRRVCERGGHHNMYITSCQHNIHKAGSS
jgi:hypothetical protein